MACPKKLFPATCDQFVAAGNTDADAAADAAGLCTVAYPLRAAPMMKDVGGARGLAPAFARPGPGSGAAATQMSEMTQCSGKAIDVFLFAPALVLELAAPLR